VKALGLTVILLTRNKQWIILFYHEMQV